jgi:hypothetical protein
MRDRTSPKSGHGGADRRPPGRGSREGGRAPRQRDADPRSEDSFDERAGSLATMLDFDRPRDGKLFLDPATGERLNDGDD